MAGCGRWSPKAKGRVKIFRGLITKHRITPFCKRDCKTSRIARESRVQHYAIGAWWDSGGKGGQNQGKQNSRDCTTWFEDDQCAKFSLCPKRIFEKYPIGMSIPPMLHSPATQFFPSCSNMGFVAQCAISATAPCGVNFIPLAWRDSYKMADYFVSDVRLVLMDRMLHNSTIHYLRQQRRRCKKWRIWFNSKIKS